MFRIPGNLPCKAPEYPILKLSSIGLPEALTRILGAGQMPGESLPQWCRRADRWRPGAVGRQAANPSCFWDPSLIGSRSHLPPGEREKKTVPQGSPEQRAVAKGKGRKLHSHPVLTLGKTRMPPEVRERAHAHSPAPMQSRVLRPPGKGQGVGWATYSHNIWQSLASTGAEGEQRCWESSTLDLRHTEGQKNKRLPCPHQGPTVSNKHRSNSLQLREGQEPREKHGLRCRHTESAESRGWSKAPGKLLQQPNPYRD